MLGGKLHAFAIYPRIFCYEAGYTSEPVRMPVSSTDINPSSDTRY